MTDSNDTTNTNYEDSTHLSSSTTDWPEPRWCRFPGKHLWHLVQHKYRAGYVGRCGISLKIKPLQVAALAPEDEEEVCSKCHRSLEAV